MKNLLLIRHAKAEQDGGFADFERPLKSRGIDDAMTMARRLKSKEIIPQIIVSSPALRTLATAEVFSHQLSIPGVIKTDKAIYEASDTTLLNIITTLPDENDFVALVGHNPGISQILHYLSGKYKDVPTCTVALLKFEVDSWKEISRDSGELVLYDEPKS
jgi:phosphohistidine phosphatase